jgi:hypothetical protein
MGVDLVGSGGLPGLDDVREWTALTLLNNDVNVVRHDAPRDEAVSFAVCIEERCLNETGAGGIAQMASAVSCIEQAVSV